MDYDFVVIGGGIVGIAAIALAVDFSKAQSLLFEHEICSSTFNWFKISGASQGDLCAILTPQGSAWFGKFCYLVHRKI
jgi:glycine/D-amino acid oxidase-like deaminating enzyme